MNQPQRIAKMDGKDLMIRSGSALPAVCIKSNAPVDASNVRRETLAWTPEASGRGLKLIFRYFAQRQHCGLSYENNSSSFA